MIDPASRFSHKAAIYARYRWDYSPQAIDDIFRLSRLSPEAAVADIGAGTGMLSRLFVERVKAVYSIEPNVEMRGLAQSALKAYVNCLIIDGLAEQTPFRDHSIDLIVVGRAIHWFDPLKARLEFRRILKAEGWLALLRVPCKDTNLVEATRSIRTEENGWDTSRDKDRQSATPLSYFYGDDNFSTHLYPDSIQETWQEFFGRLSSLSPAPDESHVKYPKFRQAAEEVFRQFSVDGRLRVPIATELQLGQMKVA